MRSWLAALAEVLDVDVSAEAGVVGEVPAGVVRIFVDNDLVGVPEPAVDVAKVVRGYAKVEASKPEAGWATTAQTPDVGGAEAAVEVAVLPGMVEMVVGVVAAGIVAYPVVFVDVRGVGMAGMVDITTVGGRGWTVIRFGAVSGGWMRRRSTAAGMASAGMLLCNCRKGDKKSDQE
jgi:hypothetical protein